METVDVSFSISSCSGERQELAKRQVPSREREKFNSNEVSFIKNENIKESPC
jgi:hypothetical protein